jgi:hypothetical protein
MESPLRTWNRVPRSTRSRSRHASLEPTGYLAMTRSLLMLRPSYEGWKLMDDGKPVFWFPEKSAALAVANTIAEARHTFSNRPTGVEVESEGKPPERVSTYG